MILDLKRTIVYGPVQSRRLGRSLGINLLPAGRKTCSFDCQYCQYGWTPGAGGRAGAGEPPAVAAVARAVEEALRALPEPPACLTFSGHGEATLHPDFAAMVGAVISVRDAVTPSARTAILSNSSTVGSAAVRRALDRLDLRVMKLDAGNQGTLARFNQPRDGSRLADIVAGLRALSGVTLQSLFAAGPAGNLAAGDVADWLDAVAAIAPLAVQIYTLDRGVPSQRIAPAPRPALDGIAAALAARGVPATVF